MILKNKKFEIEKKINNNFTSRFIRDRPLKYQNPKIVRIIVKKQKMA